MSMHVRKQYFLSAMEFSCCCTAAGITGLPCFANLPDEQAGSAAEAVCAMARRGLLTAEGEGFVLCPELSCAFRTMKASRAVVSVCRQWFDLPYCLLYGTPAHLVSLQPGRRREEYLGVTLYRTEDAAEWLEDLSFPPGGNLPDDLLEAVSAEEAEADLSQAPGLEDFLSRHMRDTEERPEDIPEEVTGCVECRLLPGLGLLGRLFLVRLPLYDHLVTSTTDGAHAEIYRTRRAAEVICGLLNGEDK